MCKNRVRVYYNIINVSSMAAADPVVNRYIDLDGQVLPLAATPPPPFLF